SFIRDRLGAARRHHQFDHQFSKEAAGARPYRRSAAAKAWKEACRGRSGHPCRWRERLGRACDVNLFDSSGKIIPLTEGFASTSYFLGGELWGEARLKSRPARKRKAREKGKQP